MYVFSNEISHDVIISFKLDHNSLSLHLTCPYVLSVNLIDINYLVLLFLIDLKFKVFVLILFDRVLITIFILNFDTIHVALTSSTYLTVSHGPVNK